LPTPTGFGKLFAFSVNDKLLMWSPLTSPFTTFADGPTLQEERKWRQKQEERRRQEEEAHLSNVRILFFDHLTRLICRPWLKHIRTYINMLLFPSETVAFGVAHHATTPAINRK
jgi:hypothetical protein